LELLKKWYVYDMREAERHGREGIWLLRMNEVKEPVKASDKASQ